MKQKTQAVHAVMLIVLGSITGASATENSRYSNDGAASDVRVNADFDENAASADVVREGDQTTPVDAAEQARMKQFLDERIDRAAVRKTLTTADGRRIDCIDLHAQPAMKNPDLAGHEIELAPKSLPAGRMQPNAQPMMEPLFESTPDGATIPAAGCPQGTVPIPEITQSDLQRFASLDDYFRKPLSSYGTELDLASDGGIGAPLTQNNVPTNLYQFAQIYRNVTNWGAQANINVWRTHTELAKEYSLSQVRISAGSGHGLQTLEGGVQVYRQLYNDHEPHLFIYSTRDGYGRTGCYNNSCRDFVQINRNIYPGGRIGPVSVYRGQQYDLQVEWYKDTDTGHWWLGVQGQWVGYYPRSLYNAAGALNHAQRFSFGGHILDYRNNNRHTTTDMGSGDYPAAGWQRAAYMRLLRYNYAAQSNPRTVWETDVTGVTTNRSDARCYDVSNLYWGNPSWRSYFFFGGPGFNGGSCR